LALEVPLPKFKPSGRSYMSKSSNGSSTLTLPATQPRVRFVESQPKATRIPRKERRIAIRHASKHRLLAVIQIVSPENKENNRYFNSFVDKPVILLKRGFLFLIIAPFPPTPRDLNGIHAAIWHNLVRKRFTLPADKPLTLAAYTSERGEQFAA